MKYIKSLWNKLVDIISAAVYNVPEAKVVPVVEQVSVAKKEPKVIATTPGTKGQPKVPKPKPKAK